MNCRYFCLEDSNTVTNHLPMRVLYICIYGDTYTFACAHTRIHLPTQTPLKLHVCIIHIRIDVHGSRTPRCLGIQERVNV